MSASPLVRQPVQCTACGRTVTARSGGDPWARRCGCGRTVFPADEVLREEVADVE